MTNFSLNLQKKNMINIIYVMLFWWLFCNTLAKVKSLPPQLLLAHTGAHCFTLYTVFLLCKIYNLWVLKWPEIIFQSYIINLYLSTHNIKATSTGILVPTRRLTFQTFLWYSYNCINFVCMLIFYSWKIPQ